MVIFFSVIPIVFKSDLYYTNNGYAVLWLSVLYIIGGYIKKYELYKKISNIKCVLLYFSAVLVTFGQKVITEYVKYSINGKIVNEGMFIKYTSPTMVLCAVSLLCLFAKINLKDVVKKVVAFFTPFAFSVYLIHTAPFVWSKVMKNRFVAFAELNPIIMILVVFGTAIAIFIGCSLIDFLRVQIFKLLKIKELSVKIEKAIAKKVDKIKNTEPIKL
jgi:hypothetical protein